MANSRVCTECQAALPDGVPDVFCPACALRVEVAGTQQRFFGRVAGVLGRLWDGCCESLGLGSQTAASRMHLYSDTTDTVRGSVMNSPSQVPQPGDVIEDYKILEKVGGNMGLVVKAHHRLLNKTVALKLLPKDWTKDGPRIARFRREIQILAQLDHPNLVKAMDARSVGGWQVVAMEWVDGMDLHQLMTMHGRIPISDACEAVRQAALGLQHAHEHGLIHRDIKPSNLMLSSAGTIKVIDMGLALNRDEAASSLTQSGVVMGTMNYCAPEQIRNPSTVDIRADIYSLGCTLYHLLAGRPPHASRKTMTDVVHAHLEEPFPKISEARLDAPEGLEAVLNRMTEKDPAARFTTPSDVVEALGAFARGAKLEALVRPQGKSDPHPTLRSGKSTLGTNEGGRSRGSYWMRWVAVGLGLIGIVAAVNFWKDRNSHIPVHGLESSQAPVSTMVRPVVVLMDTSAQRGNYKPGNPEFGRNNAMDLQDLFKEQIKEIPFESIKPEAVGLNWDGRNRVRAMHPDLILIHRSVFFHPLAAALGIRYRDEWRNLEDQKTFEAAYAHLGDGALREFIRDIGSSNPTTKFLVYSRGTDTNWLSSDFRQKWAEKLETSNPDLKGRINTMLVEGEQKGTFDDPPTNRVVVLQKVRKILGLPTRD